MIDIILPRETVDYYSVLPDPEDITEEFVADIKHHGIQVPLRLYTNGVKGVLRDGHHRLAVARQLEIKTLPIQIIPDWLEEKHNLPSLEPLVTDWLAHNLDYRHTEHRTTRITKDKRYTEVRCKCGESWREDHYDNQWESVLGHPRLLPAIKKRVSKCSASLRTFVHHSLVSNPLHLSRDF